MVLNHMITDLNKVTCMLTCGGRKVNCKLKNNWERRGQEIGEKGKSNWREGCACWNQEAALFFEGLEKWEKR